MAGRGWTLPVAIAFAVGFLALSGFYVAIDNLAPSRQPRAGDTPKPAEPTAFQTILTTIAPMLRERCAKAARAALAQNGTDPGNGDADKAINSYCACTVDRSTEEMSIGEFLAFRFNPSSEPAASKMKDIMQKCQEAIRR